MKTSPSIPIFSSNNLKQGKLFHEFVHIECLPLNRSLFYQPYKEALEVVTELNRVPNHFILLYEAMSWDITLDLYNFSQEFAEMITAGFLKSQVEDFKNEKAFKQATNIQVKKLYRVHNFLQNRTFSTLSKSILESLDCDLYSQKHLTEISHKYWAEIKDSINSNDLREVNYPDDWASFVTKIRKNVARTHGIYYDQL